MSIAVSLICALLLTVLSAECFRTLQSASYRPERMYVKILISWYFLSLVLTEIVAVVIRNYSFYCTLALYVVVTLVWVLVKRKTPLKVTKRVFRMFVVQFAILGILCVFVGNNYWAALLPIVTLVSWLICLPIDVCIAKYYLKRACNKLGQSGVTVIAITGSYGKTSVKDMLAVLLKDSIAPKGSCNTPMGIAQFVNKTDLTGAKYLVLEFGARKKGDIAQLCQLFKPTYGIVTGICPQHLSTFKTFDNIIATKRELVESLPRYGLCVLNQQDEQARQFAGCGSCAKYFSYDGMQIQSISTNFDGCELQITIDGVSHTAHLPQISDYVADTFAMCLQMTLQLNQDITVTLSRVGGVTQTPHRMQLYKGANCYILDDSYNGSITGVSSCCKTLSKFNCTKVVITQGIVECGDKRRELNVECGRLLGTACDVAVVLGRNAKCLAEGLLATNCKILHAKNLTQAVQIATKHVNGGILLFQNDLPDAINL